MYYSLMVSSLRPCGLIPPGIYSYRLFCLSKAPWGQVYLLFGFTRLILFTIAVCIISIVKYCNSFTIKTKTMILLNDLCILKNVFYLRHELLQAYHPEFRVCHITSHHNYNIHEFH